jgi:phage gp36-like protein
MAYVTAAEVITRVGTEKAAQLTTDSGSTPDSSMISAVILEVEAEINSAVRQRSSTAITGASHPNTLALLAGKSMAMTIYRLCGRRPPVPEDVKDGNGQALQWLSDLVDGKRQLPDDTLNAEGPTWSSSTADASRETMVG